MTFPAHHLPVHTPGCRAGRAQPHPGCLYQGTTSRLTERRRASGRLRQTSTCCFPQVGELRAQRGHRPGQEVTWLEPPGLLFSIYLSDAFNGFKAFKLSLSLRWNLRVSSTNQTGIRLGYRRHDTPSPPSLAVPLPTLAVPTGRPLGLQGSTGNWGSGSFCEAGRGSQVCCVSLSAVPGFIISKGDIIIP